MCMYLLFVAAACCSLLCIQIILCFSWLLFLVKDDWKKTFRKTKLKASLKPPHLLKFLKTKTKTKQTNKKKRQKHGTKPPWEKKKINSDAYRRRWNKNAIQKIPCWLSLDIAFKSFIKLKLLAYICILSSGIVRLDSYKTVNYPLTGNFTHYRKMSQFELNVWRNL